ncbi:MAG: hypothetical protein A2W25_04400 [candidate division Zixibacteria bacterium RBG_16_53_22]|nr:MAG: hypothetical protein A2W25_04400 [candidate division Zixibacteria bacterium RBG_16_53_22]
MTIRMGRRAKKIYLLVKDGRPLIFERYPDVIMPLAFFTKKQAIDALKEIDDEKVGVLEFDIPILSKQKAKEIHKKLEMVRWANKRLEDALKNAPKEKGHIVAHVEKCLICMAFLWTCPRCGVNQCDCTDPTGIHRKAAKAKWRGCNK